MDSLVAAFICLVVGHFIADFVFQTEEQAINKSKNFDYLVDHTFTYSIIMATIAGFLFDGGIIQVLYKSIVFGAFTFAFHTIQDALTSRLNKKLAPKEETIMLKRDFSQPAKPVVIFPEGRSYHNFFVGIGFDQMLHYIQLFLTFYILYKL